jgi:hypothetical protein
MARTRGQGITTSAWLVLFAVGLAAGNAHFVGVPTLTVVDETAFVSGKVAGLGNVPQIHVVLSGDAACVNPGNQHPQAANKATFTAEGDFPVQNGKANFQLSIDATFQPSCTPPMTVAWANLTVTVTAVDGTVLVYP